MIFGKIDQKIREKTTNDLIKGTLYQYLYDDQVCVLLENNDMWIGHIRDVALEAEQD